MSTSTPPPIALGTVFVTAPDGKIFELPRSVAESYVVTPEREKELGHLPLQPYTALVPRTPPPIGAEVSLRHRVAPLGPGASLPEAWVYHTTWEYGAYMDAASGDFMVGFHRHPYATEEAETASESDFT